MRGVYIFNAFNVTTFQILQNVLRELEQKKPQLDELVHTAENLRADTNRQQLHGKGKVFVFIFFFHFFRKIIMHGKGMIIFLKNLAILPDRQEEEETNSITWLIETLIDAILTSFCRHN